MVRTLEYRRSVQFILDSLASLPSGGIGAEPRLRCRAIPWPYPSSKDGGERFATVRSRPGRPFLRYQVTDPSFHNCSDSALALRGQQISDFPLCNKSFNLSYCGFDL